MSSDKMMNPQSTKTFSRKVAVILSLGVALVVLIVSIFLQTHLLSAYSMFAGSAPAAATTTAPVAPGVGASYDVPGRPVRLVIPAIGVDANVQSVGDWWRDPSEMGIPTNLTDVGWYNKGPKPGSPGSAVIDGHLDGKDVKEAVFYNLDKLQPGDLVQIQESGGKTLQFKVVATKLYDYNAPTNDIFDPDASHTRLNLITCAGDWIKGQGQYNQRVVVFTELVT